MASERSVVATHVKVTGMDQPIDNGRQLMFPFDELGCGRSAGLEPGRVKQGAGFLLIDSRCIRELRT